MSISRIALAAVAASFLSFPAWAEDAPTASPPGAGHAMAMHGMFTREERMMLFADMDKATSGMSDDQKKDYRHQQRARIMAMSDDDRLKFKSDLDARWSALPADQKAAMTAKMQAFMASRHSGGGEQ